MQAFDWKTIDSNKILKFHKKRVATKCIYLKYVFVLAMMSLMGKLSTQTIFNDRQITTISSKKKKQTNRKKCFFFDCARRRRRWRRNVNKIKGKKYHKIGIRNLKNKMIHVTIRNEYFFFYKKNLSISLSHSLLKDDDDDDADVVFMFSSLFLSFFFCFSSSLLDRTKRIHYDEHRTKKSKKKKY